jgi:hypothetical protein
VISLFVMIGEWFWSILESAIERSEAWFFTRRWDVATGGIPACAVAVVLAFILIGQYTKGSVAVAEPYREAFRVAVDARECDRAELFLRKLVALQAADANHRFQYALLAEDAGRTEEAAEEMSALAPDGEAGYPLAHLWMARKELARRPTWNADDRERCFRRLTSAKANPISQSQASVLLGALHVVEQNLEGAAVELNSSSELDEALKLANSIGGGLADGVEIRQTRGQILLRQRQWQAAITDLEWVLPRIKLESKTTVHAALAKAYAELGDKQRAEHYRGLGTNP